MPRRRKGEAGDAGASDSRRPVHTLELHDVNQIEDDRAPEARTDFMWTWELRFMKVRRRFLKSF